MAPLIPSCRPRAGFSVLAVALSACAVARAGGRPYAYTQGFDSLPANSVELENWFGASTVRIGAGLASQWEWWTGPVTGITDRIEAGLFAVLDQPLGVAGTQSSAITLSQMRLQLTYSLADKGDWPVDVRVRLEGGLPAQSSVDSTAWLTAILSRDLGGLNVTANLGGWVGKETYPGRAEIYSDYLYALGISYKLGRAFRIGAEAFGETFVNDAAGNHEWQHSAGPSISFGTGRVWLAATVGFGIGSEAPVRRSRVVFGLAF